MSERKPNTCQIEFNNYLVEFIQKFQTSMPSEKKLFSKYYKYYRGYVDQDKRIEFIEEFVGYMSRYADEIAKRDEGLFSEEEEYYPGKSIQLMKGIDFKRIWRQEMSSVSKNNVWEYLQTLYLIGTFVMKQANRQKEILKKQEEIIHNLLQSIRSAQEIKKTADDQDKKEEQEQSASKQEGFEGIKNLLTDDNILTQIVKEIVDELHPSGVSDPVQALMLLTGKDQTKLNDIMSKVSQRVKTVLTEKGVTETQLYDQAQQTCDKLFGMLKDVPGMTSIKQHIMTELAKPKTSNDPEEYADLARELNDHLKQNLSQLGIDDLQDLEEFQKKIQSEKETEDAELSEKLKNIRKNGDAPQK